MFNNKKGQVGLNLFLSLLATIFIIGIIVMCFMLIGTKIKDSDALYLEGGVANFSNSTVTTVIYGTPRALLAGYRNPVCTLGLVWNGSGGVQIGTGNYSESSECYINYTGADSTDFNNTNWLVNFGVTYDKNASEAIEAIDELSDSMQESTSFFSIIIIIGAVVVLILLIVLIINSLKQSGFLGGGGA